jgi:hypothetical protein
MVDLDRQLREFGSFVDDNIEPVPVVEITDRARRPAIEPWRRPLAVAGVAAAIIILVLVAVVVADPFGEEAPFIEEPTTAPTTTVPVSTTAATETTAAPATTATAAPAIEHPTISWVRVESDAFAGDGVIQINDVTEGGPGLVAVGNVFFDFDVPYQAAIWHSADGTTWSRVPHDEDLFGDALINAVVAGGPGLVAVGNAGSLDEDSAAAVWVSENGITWSRVPHDETQLGGPMLQDMYDVVVAGPGLVAVGWDNLLDWTASGAAWTSSDGLTWERVPHDPDIFGEGFQGMWSVASGDGGLVAVGLGAGWSGSGGPGQPAAVWTSPDGLTWTRTPEQEQLESGHPTDGFPGGGDWAVMHEVTTAAGGYVAVGRLGWCQSSASCEEEAGAWVSTNGTEWQRGRVERAIGVSSTMLEGVVEIGEVLVGVGRGHSPPQEDGPAVVWTSIDNGLTWARQPHSGSAFGQTSGGSVSMYAVIEHGSDLVAAGYWESDAAVWIGTIED